MNKPVMRIGLVLLCVVLILAWKLLGGDDYLTFEKLREHRAALQQFVAHHYLQAVLAFLVLYMATALLLPGALVLTIAGGMLFGMTQTVVFVNLAGTAGCTFAFLLSRFLLGGWIQERFARQLEQLNRELARHGRNYLLILRILPVLPLFVINYGAGLTGIPLSTFVWTTSLGILPGSFVYSFAGQQLSTIDSLEGLLSWPIILAMLLLSFFALLPVILHHSRAYRAR